MIKQLPFNVFSLAVFPFGDWANRNDLMSSFLKNLSEVGSLPDKQ